MKDFCDREIKVGDRCIRYTGQLAGLEEVIVLGEDDKGVKILNYLDKEVYTSEHKLFDLSAFERQIRSETFINSIKGITVMPNDTVIASIIPHQFNCNEAYGLLEQLKEVFPNNKRIVVTGLEISTEGGD